MKATTIFTLLFCILLISPIESQAQKSKKRKREIKRYWKKEVRHAKSINHKKVAAQYPTMGWISGLWCREGEDEPSLSFEVEGKNKIRKTTRGYTATSHRDVFIPDNILFLEGKTLGKPVVINNESFIDLWSFPKGTGASTYRWFYLMRIKKVSDDKFEDVNWESFTIRDPSVDYEEFYRNKSPEVSIRKNRKKPIVYVKCN